MAKPLKTIGIDARFYGPIGKGLGRYTQEIVDYLVKNDSEHQYVIFLNSHNFANFPADGKRIRKVLADVPWYSLAEQIALPRLIKQHQIDLMHFPHFNVPIFCPVNFIVTIHDLILTKYPTVRASTLSPVLYQFKNLAYKLVISRAIRQAQKIITVSHFTKSDIVKHFGIKSDKVIVTYEGVATLSAKSDNSNDSKAHLSRLKVSKAYLLYVGNAYPHKNLERLLQVTRPLLKRHNLQLVLVGKRDYFYQRLVNLTATWSKTDRQQVVFAGFVSDDTLDLLYRQALAYVFPSLYEGFGLPPLEAMSKLCPVASSNRSSMPEILGSAAIYFDPEDNADLLKQLELLVTNTTLRQSLIKLGEERVKLYNWTTCAKSTLAVYQSVL